MIKIGLSIDFDFFCREDVLWDFGHTESQAIYQSSAVWALRYLHYDLEKESSIDQADFYPLDLFNQLRDRKLSLMDTATVGFADSHRFAYDFFAPYADQLDLIINLDAHHDCWPYEEGNVDCGNWLNALSKKSLWVYPTWKNPILDEDPSCAIDKISWADFDMEEDNQVMAMFVCRSSAWVPPHFDNLYSKFAEMISCRLYPQILQGVNPREDLNYAALANKRVAMQKLLGAVNTPRSDHPDKG